MTKKYIMRGEKINFQKVGELFVTALVYKRVAQKRDVKRLAKISEMLLFEIEKLTPTDELETICLDILDKIEEN